MEDIPVEEKQLTKYYKVDSTGHDYSRMPSLGAENVMNAKEQEG